MLKKHGDGVVTNREPVCKDLSGFLLSEETLETIISPQMRIDLPLPAGNVSEYKYLESMHNWPLHSVSIFAANLIGQWF